MEKYKCADIVGIERENERDENYKSTRNPQIDKSKTRLNYHAVPYEKKYLAFIDERIKQLSPKRKIKDDAVLVTSFILGSDKEFFDRITAEQQKQFFADCTEFFSKRYGKENVVSAVVHLDESTPHLHLNLMPVTNGRLCAKELLDRTALRNLQTDFYEAVGKKYGLERGKEGSTAKHLDTVAYKTKKMTEVAEANAKAGKYRSTHAPYGYVKGSDDKALPVRDEPAATIVHRIFEMRASCKTYKEIYTVLNDEKVPIPAVYLYEKFGITNKKPNKNLWADSICGVF